MTAEALGHEDSEAAAGNVDNCDDKNKSKQPVWKKPQKKKSGKKVRSGLEIYLENRFRTLQMYLRTKFHQGQIFVTPSINQVPKVHFIESIEDLSNFFLKSLTYMMTIFGKKLLCFLNTTTISWQISTSPPINSPSVETILGHVTSFFVRRVLQKI
jgi:hypothetical protein